MPFIHTATSVAERAHRFGVMWDKRRQGTHSEKGNCETERVLSFRQTCRI
jgi:transposase